MRGQGALKEERELGTRKLGEMDSLIIVVA